MAEQSQEASLEAKEISEAAVGQLISHIKDALNNKADKNGNKVLSTNDFTDEEKNKLDGIETNADVNTIESITVNGTEITPDANKNVALTVITNSVNNLLNYYLKSETYTKEEVNALVNAIKTVTFEAVDVLPTANIKTNVIYLVPKASSKNKNAKDEYINLDGTTEGWELIGDTAVDLTGYVTESMLNTALANYTTTENLTALLDNKVDKVEGKGLSTNDYTDAEKTKLAGLSNYDDTSLSGRVTTVENTLSDKVDKVEGKGLSTEDYTTEEKSKLNSLSNYDDTALAGRITDIEEIIPSTASNENRLATMEDISGGSEVSVEQKVSEGVNIASITIDGHTTEIFAPEGSDSPSTITIVNPNLYDASIATKGSGNDYNIYCEVSVSPNTDYVFDIQNSPYGWAGVRVGNTTIGNNDFGRKLVEFNSGTNTSVRLQFFPGNDTTVAQTDFSNILFYEAGKIPGETTTIENPNSGSGSSLISTDITEILLTASPQHPIEIVLIGDSITEGYSATGSLNAGSTHPLPTWANFPSWAGKLNSYITANFPNVTVTNRGYSGQVSSYGASNINSWITNNRQIAIVMFGTNNRTSQANMDSLANDYTTMLNRCKSVGAKMIPMCCIPTTPYNQSISGKYVGTMEQVHNILVNWAKTNGYELLDLYSLMMAYINNNTSNLESMGLIYVGSADNNLHIHPSDAGHAVMFDFIKHKLGIGTAGGSDGGAKYRHRVAMYCLNGGTTYVVVNLYNNRSTPYNAATTTTTDEINAFKADVLAAGYSSALQKGTLMCSGVIKGTHVYGMYMGTSSSGLSAVADKLNFIDGTNFNVTLPLETGGTNSASSSLRLWDTVEPA